MSRATKDCFSVSPLETGGYPGPQQVFEWTTNLHKGTLNIENGAVTGGEADLSLANWEFFRDATKNQLTIQPYVRAVTYNGQPKLIIYDDPEPFEQEFKLFD